MTDKWILDVLGDMRNFAQLNDLPRLAEELAKVRQVASAELAERAKRKVAAE